MSKRVSVVEPPSHDSIPEANELPSPRRSHSNSNPDHLPQRSPKPVRTTQTPAISTASSKPSPTKSSVPPSPARQRVSKPIPNPRIPQQSLDAAAQLLASRPSDLSNRPVPVPGPVDHQNQIGRPSTSPITPERRPRLTTELPPSARPSVSAGASPSGYTSLAVPPIPRRTVTAPALSLDNRARPRRHTNASTKDISISNPILDHGQPILSSVMLVCIPHFQAPEATKNMSPFKNPATKPIPTRDFQVHTKRLSTG